MFSLFSSIISQIKKEEVPSINDVEPGRYPLNCNPRPKINKRIIKICGQTYVYRGTAEHVNKNYIIITSTGVHRHIIAYGPFLLVVDSNTKENFITTYEKATEKKRLDDNIPFTIHTYPEKYTPNTRVYYDGQFIYLGGSALHAPNLGGIKQFSTERIVFEHGVFENNTLKYFFKWNETEVGMKWHIY